MKTVVHQNAQLVGYTVSVYYFYTTPEVYRLHPLISTLWLRQNKSQDREALLICGWRGLFFRSATVVHAGHGSCTLWVVCHGSFGSSVMWVMDLVGYGSCGSWVVWVTGHVGHGSCVLWVMRVTGRVGHGSCGTWVIWVMGHTGYNGSRSMTQWVSCVVVRSGERFIRCAHVLVVSRWSCLCFQPGQPQTGAIITIAIQDFSLIESLSDWGFSTFSLFGLQPSS